MDYYVLILNLISSRDFEHSDYNFYFFFIFDIKIFQKIFSCILVRHTIHVKFSMHTPIFVGLLTMFSQKINIFVLSTCEISSRTKSYARVRLPLSFSLNKFGRSESALHGIQRCENEHRYSIHRLSRFNSGKCH